MVLALTAVELLAEKAVLGGEDERDSEEHGRGEDDGASGGDAPVERDVETNDAANNRDGDTEGEHGVQSVGQ